MITHSPYEEVQLGASSISNFVLRNAAAQADKTAILDGSTGQAVSCGAFGRSVLDVAKGLVANGVEPVTWWR